MPESNERTYHVGFAIVASESIFDLPLRDMLNESWVPGATITRYGRTWHLTQMHQPAGGVVSGEIGFVTDAQLASVFFDPGTQEFVSNDVSTGTRVPFVIEVESGAIAYQLYPGTVRENTFTGALQELLNTRSLYALTVRSSTQVLSWPEWKSRIERITSFEIRLERPNPHYGDDELIENAIESLRLEYLRLSGKALDEGVDPDADLFQQAMDHVIREYGRAAIHGLTGQGEQSTWVKVKNYAGSILARMTVKLTGGPAIEEQELVEALQARGDLVPAPPGAEELSRDAADE